MLKRLISRRYVHDTPEIVVPHASAQPSVSPESSQYKPPPITPHHRFSSREPGEGKSWNQVDPSVSGFAGGNQEVISHHPQHYPDVQRAFYAKTGTDIANEEPIFGAHGYRPLPAQTQKNYAVADAWASVTMTSTKAVRLPDTAKRVLPDPATKVAIFGCTSFQGSRIAKRLVLAPEIKELRLCTRYPDQIPPDLQKVIDLNPEKCTLEEANVLDKPSVNRAINGCDGIVNAVDCRTDDFYQLHHDIWIKGVQNICYQARVVGIKRFVFVSGLDAIFGNDSDRSDGRAKAEDMALAENFFSTVVRPGELYGAGYRYTAFGKLCYPTVYPNTNIQPTWVNDLAEATFRVLQDRNSVKRVIDLGGPKVMTHMQYATERALYHKGPAPFPCPVWLGDTAAFFNELLTPRPHFSRDMICEMEQEQIARTKENNPYVWSWEDLGMEPTDIKTAAEREAAGEAF